eukprot:gnl/Carplike_NY0171/2804_a3767_392.p1 GENE.gnl/Carplike_NY0171/2804_a3767_392~~gnl/Carplike_NY0171/2804_a3767_392.p1  ORF type:complete len:564 (+),score=133.48 gnl/Carplike_NY0171/2804_a3767_392:712-2403(+)
MSSIVLVVVDKLVEYGCLTGRKVLSYHDSHEESCLFSVQPFLSFLVNICSVLDHPIQVFLEIQGTLRCLYDRILAEKQFQLQHIDKEAEETQIDSRGFVLWSRLMNIFASIPSLAHELKDFEPLMMECDAHLPAFSDIPSKYGYKSFSRCLSFSLGEASSMKSIESTHYSESSFCHSARTLSQSQGIDVSTSVVSSDYGTSNPSICPHHSLDPSVHGHYDPHRPEWSVNEDEDEDEEDSLSEIQITTRTVTARGERSLFSSLGVQDNLRSASHGNIYLLSSCSSTQQAHSCPCPANSSDYLKEVVVPMGTDLQEGFVLDSGVDMAVLLPEELDSHHTQVSNESQPSWVGVETSRDVPLITLATDDESSKQSIRTKDTPVFQSACSLELPTSVLSSVTSSLQKSSHFHPLSCSMNSRICAGSTSHESCVSSGSYDSSESSECTSEGSYNDGMACGNVKQSSLQSHIDASDSTQTSTSQGINLLTFSNSGQKNQISSANPIFTSFPSPSMESLSGRTDIMLIESTSRGATPSLSSRSGFLDVDESFSHSHEDVASEHIPLLEFPK